MSKTITITNLDKKFNTELCSGISCKSFTRHQQLKAIAWREIQK